MTSPIRTWIWFALVCAVILTAAGWMGATVWEQDAREQRTGAQALWEQKVQAALWRMDAAASAIVAREAARRPEEMARLAKETEAWALQEEAKPKVVTGTPQPRAIAATSDKTRIGSSLPPAPAAAPPQAAAKKTAEAAPTGDALAEGNKKNPARYFNRSESKLDQTKGASADAKVGIWSSSAAEPAMEGSATHAARIPEKAAKAEAPAASRFKLSNETNGQLLGNQAAEAQIRAQVDNSYAQRSVANQAYNSNFSGADFAESLRQDAAPAKDARDHAVLPAQNLLAASAEDGDIVLSRRVETPRRDLVQGVRLDAEAVAEELLPLARVDFPKAQLRPEPDPQTHSARTLAAMPLRFFPGEEPVILIGWSPVRTAVAAAGTAFLVALGAVALLLARTLALSQRRAEFVSTMTHELRTPLTTFRLYTDLLEAAPETADRARYTQVLAREAERLSHLVENVLAYARLEHGRRKPQARPMGMQDLVAGLEPRLHERAERAGFTLEVQGASNASVSAHPSTIEQILLNLVDNAGKYAASAADKRLVLEVADHAIALRDFGPGLDPAIGGRLFTAFSRSDKEAAGGAPGVGLGLALSRRLAREMGGDLRHEEARPGARFTLELARG